MCNKIKNNLSRINLHRSTETRISRMDTVDLVLMDTVDLLLMDTVDLL